MIKWEDPPRKLYNRHHGGKKWAAEADELRAHPGRWGLLREIPASQAINARALSWRIGHARMVAFRPLGAFESTSHLDGDVIKIYARYVKEGD